MNSPPSFQSRLGSVRVIVPLQVHMPYRPFADTYRIQPRFFCTGCLEEAARLECLKRYQILDTPPDTQFDKLVQLASYICATPIALITLVEEGRQWFKAQVGLSFTETDRAYSFCHYTIQGEQILEIPDARQDERFMHNPLVTGPPLMRYYCGAPLTTPEGFRLGSLCVIDQVPRTLTAGQKYALQTLAGEVSNRLQMHRQQRQLAKAHQQLIAEKEKVTRSEKRYRQLIENAASFIFTHTFTGVILSANPAATQMLRVEKSSGIIGKSLQSYVARESLDAFRKYLLDLSDTNLLSVTLRMRTRQEERWWLYRSFRFDEADGTAYIIVSAQDITEREKAMQVLQQAHAQIEQQVQDRTRDLRLSNKELTSIRQGLSKLLYQASHNLLGPVCTLQGLVNLAQETSTSVAQGQLNQLVSQTVNKLYKLMSDIIAYSENVQLPVVKGEIDWHDVLRQAIDSCAQLKDWNRFKLAIRIDPAIRCISDQHRLVVLFTHLLENARHFQNPYVRTPSLAINITGTESHVIIYVWDNGDPIAEEHLPHIFELFYLYSQKPGCSGIALHLVKEIVRTLNGQIKVCSRPETGTSFTIELPHIPMP